MKKVAIVVGHLPTDRGAYNKTHDMGEFDFNNELAPMVARHVRLLGMRPVIIYRETYNNLPGQINAAMDHNGDSICLSLHCNAANGKPNGTEVLYYHGSSNSKRLATLLLDEITDCLGLKNRGLKPVDYEYQGSQNDRGGYLLKKTAMPAVIVEPFFIDADSSLELALSKMDDLAKAYAEGCARYFNLK